MERPNSQAVIKTLQAYRTAPKFRTFLFASHPTGMSYSIEGVFVKAALDLGFGSDVLDQELIPSLTVRYINEPDDIKPYMSYVDPNSFYRVVYLFHNTKWHSIKMPEGIYTYLGIRQRLCRKDLEEAGLTPYVNEHYSTNHHKGVLSPNKDGYHRWQRLNDFTLLSIGELIHLATHLLSKER